MLHVVGPAVAKNNIINIVLEQKSSLESTMSMSLWKVEGALRSPKDIKGYSSFPTQYKGLSLLMLASDMGTWWKLLFKASFDRYLAFSRLSIMSST